MSGGVDSSVAAALLAEGGMDVVGVTLKVWDDSRCCSLSDADDARGVARRLGIPHYVIDARAAFEELIIAPFLETYGLGMTPNPCVQCNRRLKFGWLLTRIALWGCRRLATGHYARIRENPDGGKSLLRGLDHSKDQSYFVAPQSPETLERLLFPLGGHTKADIRGMAAGLDLPVASKPDSQDLCFIQKGGLDRFMEANRAKGTRGKVVDLEGRTLGSHEGIDRYTIGQRKGLGIASKAPLYVIDKIPGENLLVLGPKENAQARSFTVADCNWLEADAATALISCSVRTRSTGRIEPCKVVREDDRAFVELAEPLFAVAPGQFAVFYDGEVVLGAGWISSRTP